MTPSQKILYALRDAYPNSLTTKQLVEKTGEPQSTINQYRGNLVSRKFIKELKGKNRKPGRPSGTIEAPRSSRYVIEDANYFIYSKDRYKLAHGNVEYPTEFLRISERLLNMKP